MILTVDIVSIIIISFLLTNQILIFFNFYFWKGLCHFKHAPDAEVTLLCPAPWEECPALSTGCPAPLQGARILEQVVRLHQLGVQLIEPDNGSGCLNRFPAALHYDHLKMGKVNYYKCIIKKFNPQYYYQCLEICSGKFWACFHNERQSW